MAKVAAAGALPSNSLQTGSLKVAAPMVKRKTPSELRGEQLKRTNFAEHVDESSVPLRGCKSTTEADDGIKKQELVRNPRYIDTRMDEIYPVRKSSFRMLLGKENSKENSLKEQSSSLKHISLLSSVAANKRQQLSCPENDAASAEVSDDANAQAHQTIEMRSQTRFRSVTELSAAGNIPSSLATVDMNKALKALAACDPLMGFPAESAEKSGHPSLNGTFFSEFHVPGQKVPLDLTLKTYVRLVCSSSVKWIHKSITCDTYNGSREFRSHRDNEKNQNASNSSGSIMFSQAVNCMTYSWVYPQSILPPSLISVLSSSATEGAGNNFLRKRQLAWEESFRSLYYMLRKNICNIFYVCTSQFVVMFTADCGSMTVKSSCNAYISQSTRRMRALLKEHDICFSMPLCRTKIEEVTTEDLLELAEIEKYILGQTRGKHSFSAIDNTPQSLLAFIGNESVQGLYDFLLNYRSFLSFLTAVDVPALYSPVPFQNSALSSPEVKCMEMKTTEHIGDASKFSQKQNESCRDSPSGLCSIVEIKDAYLPPWILSSICAIMGADGRSFEASFVTEGTSAGFNIALPEISEKIGAEGSRRREDKEAFGLTGAVISPHLRSGELKSLKYCNNSYKVSLSPL